MTKVLTTIIGVILVSVFLVGCATKNDARMAEAHYQAQAQANDKPLVVMRAQPGETIMLSGVEEFAVYSPDRAVNQFRVQHHPIWGITGDILGVATPLAVMGHYGNRIADTVGSYSGDNISGSYNTDIDESISNEGRMGSPDDYSIDNSGRMESPDDYSIDNPGRFDSPDNIDNSVREPSTESQTE